MIRTFMEVEVEFTAARYTSDGAAIEVQARRFSDMLPISNSAWIPLYQFKADDGLNELVAAALKVMPCDEANQLEVK